MSENSFLNHAVFEIINTSDDIQWCIRVLSGADNGPPYSKLKIYHIFPNLPRKNPNQKMWCEVNFDNKSEITMETQVDS